MFRQMTYVDEPDDGHEAKKEKIRPDIQAVKVVTVAITQIHGKLNVDLPFAKREVAYGKLTPDDYESIFKNLREIMMPLLGVTSIIDIFERLLDLNGWEKEKDEDDKKQNMLDTMEQGLEHILLRLQLQKPLKKKKGADATDAEAKGDMVKRGDKKFAAHFEKMSNEFYASRDNILHHWLEWKGIKAEENFFGKEMDPKIDEIKLRDMESKHREQRQLFLALYIIFLLHSISVAIRDFVKWADEHDQSTAKKRLITLGKKRFKKWVVSLFSSQDSNEDDETTNVGLNRTSAVVHMGEAYNRRKDPDHLEPQNAWEKFGELLRKILCFLGSSESAFGFRVACATMSIGVIAYLADTQQWFTRQRLVWAMLMVALGMIPTTGLSMYNFFWRIFGTLIAMLAAWLVWYIPDQKTPGILVILYLFVSAGHWVPLKRMDLLIAGLISMITCVMIVGYELQVRKLGVEVATSNGQPYYKAIVLGPYRLACVTGGIGVAFFWTFFPYPITEHSTLRARLGGALYLSANLYSIMHETVIARIRGDGGDLEDKVNPSHQLLKARNKVFAKQMLTLQALRQHSAMVNYEFPLGGKFPKEEYDAIIEHHHKLCRPHRPRLPHLHPPLPPRTHPYPSLTTDPTRLHWFRSFRRVIATSNPTSHEITSLLSLLSSSVLNAQRLPPYLSPPTSYMLYAKLEDVDRDILSLKHIGEPGWHVVEGASEETLVRSGSGVTGRSLVEIEWYGCTDASFSARVLGLAIGPHCATPCVPMPLLYMKIAHSHSKIMDLISSLTLILWRFSLWFTATPVPETPFAGTSLMQTNLTAPIILNGTSTFDSADGRWSTFPIFVGPDTSDTVAGRSYNVQVSTSSSYLDLYLKPSCKPRVDGSCRSDSFDGLVLRWKFSWDPFTKQFIKDYTHQPLTQLSSQPERLGLGVSGDGKSFLENLRVQKAIPSLSYGYTAGAYYRYSNGYPGSLVLGGYDDSRLSNNNTSYDMSPESNDLVVNVMSMEYSASETRVSLMSEETLDSFNATIDSTDPYLHMPGTICDRIAEYFHLDYHANENIYSINKAAHESNIKSNSTLTIQVGRTQMRSLVSDNVTFRIFSKNFTEFTLPYAAFQSIRMLPTTYDTTMYHRYFPLKRGVNGKFILGRTFLQEAYVIVDYERRSFTVAQTAFSEATSRPQIVPIVHHSVVPLRDVSILRSLHIIKKVLSASALKTCILSMSTGILIWKIWRHFRTTRQEMGGPQKFGSAYPTFDGFEGTGCRTDQEVSDSFNRRSEGSWQSTLIPEDAQNHDIYEWKKDLLDLPAASGTHALPLQVRFKSSYDAQVTSKKESCPLRQLSQLLVVIEHSDRRSGLSETHLFTCKEYVLQRWGSEGMETLNALQNLVELFFTTGSSVSYDANFHSIRLDQKSSLLDLEISFNQYSPHSCTVIEALDFLWAAAHSPQQHSTSLQSRCCKKTCTNDKKDGLLLEFSQLQRNLSESNRNCWLNLFHKCTIIIQEAYIPTTCAVGKGLEISFEMMVSLSGAEYPVLVDGGLVLVGYQTVLVPIEIHEEYVQFHLEVNKDGQINPFLLKYGRRALCKDVLIFKSKRCFLGGLEAAYIQLGTKALPPTCLSGFQATSMFPLQAGLTGQSTFSFVSHHVRFSPTSSYTKMLADASNQTAMICDVTARRSWLVPKLSLLIYMAHVWVKDNGPGNLAPLADPYENGKTLMGQLIDKGDTVIGGHNGDALYLRNLLLGFNINLLATTGSTEKSAGNHIFGFELIDVVMEPGRGTVMKKLKLGRCSSWLSLANFADAILLCSDLGPAIAPTDARLRNCPTCSFLPAGRDYLAAHISCLDVLAHRSNARVSSAPQIVLPGNYTWTLGGYPFPRCKHNDTTNQSCWPWPTQLQRFNGKSLFQAMLDFGKGSQGAIRPAPVMPPDGAIVFGSG
ncbi:hypothetical protein BU23DRAFT_656545 [Bimuria novae-zelandiae CBS 107.79]|uniref:Uncharacterized protein n=1 Tax=Bimuria novae-zelandiae CBS 107.79 TaxID=1447943 RepID=A0A6A5UZ84_9PLEO|nr:hypothetical protein BU23DRAFT_656545 [Bimuria novae-zelandiae CBS 107.79]